MAGYLSGFVWGGLFTAAGLIVVSELTLPGDLGAKAANSPAAPMSEVAETAEESPVTETTAEVVAAEPAPAANENEAPSDAAPEVTTAEPEVSTPATSESSVETATAAETPVEPVVESPEAPVETASELATTPNETEAPPAPVTAEAPQEAEVPEVEFPQRLDLQRDACGICPAHVIQEHGRRARGCCRHRLSIVLAFDVELDAEGSDLLLTAALDEDEDRRGLVFTRAGEADERGALPLSAFAGA